MIVAIIALSVACACLMGALAFCLVRIGALVAHIEQLGELVERSLDTLDGAYDAIAKSAGQEVMQDDMFTRRVVGALLHAKRSVHEVGALLASFGDVTDDEAVSVYDRENSQQ